MTYDELSIHQKIGLKGVFMNDQDLEIYRMVMVVWNFKVAIEFFLTGDYSVIPIVNKF